MTVSIANSLLRTISWPAESTINYPHKFENDGDLIVEYVDGDGAITQALLNTEYSVTGAGDSVGGTINIKSAPAGTVSINAHRYTNLYQSVNLENMTRTDANSVEKQLDRMVRSVQDVMALQSRGVENVGATAIGASLYRAEDAEAARNLIGVATASSNTVIYNTRADALTKSVPANIDRIQVYGWSVAGDGYVRGFKRVGSDPGHFRSFQTADGAFWEDDGLPPLVILAIGQSNFRRRTTIATEHNAAGKVWNNVLQDESSVGDDFELFDDSKTSALQAFSNAGLKRINGQEIYIINVSWGGLDISHVNDGHAYSWDTGTTDADPGEGKIRGNNASITSISEIYWNYTDAFGAGKRPSILFSNQPGVDQLTITDVTGEGKFLFNITGAPTNAFTYGKIPVSYDSTISGTTLNGGVKVELSPNLKAMAIASATAALDRLGVDKISYLFWWLGESDAQFNNGDRFYDEFEQVIGKLKAEAFWEDNTRIAIFGINGPANTGQAYTGEMNRTLQRLVASDPDMRTYVNMASLPAALWKDINLVHQTAEGQNIGGEISAKAILDGNGRKNTGLVIDEDNYLQPAFGLKHVSKTIANLPTASDYPGGMFYCSDLGGGAGMVESDGSAWVPQAPKTQEVADETAFNASWLTYAPDIILTGTLTANRGISLGITGVPEGASRRFKMTGADGGFVWNIGSGPLHQLETDEVCEVTFLSGAWVATGKYTIT